MTTDAYDAMGMPNFSGDTFTILCQAGSESEVYAESENGEIVNDAVFAANRSVEEGLGVNLEVLSVAGGWSDKAVFTDYVTSSVMSGADDFQMLMGYMHYMPTLILDNLFLDINTLPHINLDNPWWADGFNDNAVINDRMYVAMGDTSTSSLRSAVCIFANRDLMKDYIYDIEDLDAAVREGTWTFDMLMDSSVNTSDIASLWASKYPTMEANLVKLLEYLREE